MSTTNGLQKQVTALEAELAQLQVFRQFVEASGQALGIASLDGQVVYMNPALCRILEVTHLEEVIGQPIAPYYPPEMQQRLQNEMGPAVMQQGQWVGELALVSPSGRVTPTLENFFVICDGQGQPLYLADVITAITERKQAEVQKEEALRDSEERYAAVVNQARDGVILVQDNLCLFANQAMAEMLGYTPAEIENTPFIRYVAPESREMIASRVKARLAGEDVPTLYEARLLRKDGTVIDAELSANIIQYRGKSADIGFIRDISERKQAEAEREQLQQEVIEAQKRAIQELSTPIIPVMERIIVMPLIGSVDSMRARDITRSLLAGIRENRAKIVILDITGVPLVDSGVANHLNKTIQAARLKGARTIVTGISDAVAETIVDLGIDWNGVETLANLQTGLVAALNSLGIKLAR